MAATTRQIRAALRRKGIEPRGRLRFLKGERIATYAQSLVVKLSYEPHAIYAYIADVRTYASANVPAEQLLVDEPIQIGEQLGIVVAHVQAVEPTRPSHAEAVGRLLRLTHDRVWPYERARRADRTSVYSWSTSSYERRPKSVIVGRLQARGPSIKTSGKTGLATRSFPCRVLEFELDEGGDHRRPDGVDQPRVDPHF